jgi:hypothetical protein
MTMERKDFWRQDCKLCGCTQDIEDMKAIFITLEDDESEQIEICKECYAEETVFSDDTKEFRILKQGKL